MEKEMSRGRLMLTLFLQLFKIGAFAFGGGYTIIALLDEEFVKKRKWIEHDEFMSVLAIAESTPGPIAINVATYIGYKLCGWFGSVITTFAVVLPAFSIMYIVSLFYDTFMANAYIAAAFKGVQVCVVYVIGAAGVRMLKKMKKKPLNWCIMAVTVVLMISLNLMGMRISSIIYILSSGLIGLAVYLASFWKKRRAEL